MSSKEVPGLDGVTLDDVRLLAMAFGRGPGSATGIEANILQDACADAAAELRVVAYTLDSDIKWVIGRIAKRLEVAAGCAASAAAILASEEVSHG